MAAPQNFRSALNGFNREDVVHYIEYLNSKHSAETNQLKSEIQNLKTELAAAQRPAPSAADLATLKQAQARCEQLEKEFSRLNAELLQARQAPAPVQEAPVDRTAEELEAYRRAERMERVARERAAQVYQQANGALAEAAVQVDDAARQLGDMADHVAQQVLQLQHAVTGSKQALQDAVAALAAIRPEDEET